MLFHVTWQFTDQTEEGERRSLEVFQSWQPPAGAEFQGFYGFADGTGGVAIVEADSAATLARTIHLPLVRHAIWGAALLVFVDCLKELPATLLAKTGIENASRAPARIVLEMCRVIGLRERRACGVRTQA